MATAFQDASAPRPFYHPDEMPDLFASPGVGRCMEPLIADGTLLVLDKRPQPRPGDVVGLWFTRDAARRYGVPGWVKRLTLPLPPAGVDDLIVVQQLNPPRQYSIPTTDVLGVHKIVGTAFKDEEGRTLFNTKQGGF